MVWPDFGKWQQSRDEIRRLALEAEHARSRERFQALYEIGSERYNASGWAKMIGRQHETVLGWVHKYNNEGPNGLLYRQSGGRSALFSESEQQAIISTVKMSKPDEYGLFGKRWTVKKLRHWIELQLNRTVSKSTIRTLLKQGRLSWKKCKKVLSKADPEERAKFVKQFQSLFAQVCRDEILLLYVDESHFHQDVDLGYAWSETGKPAYRLSPCSPLSARINWYGAYDFTAGRCLLWSEGACNTQQTVQFLQQILTWVHSDSAGIQRKVVLLWDGAPWHRSQLAQQTAQQLGFHLVQLPAYSPDLNPIEGLWKWMREEVSQQGYFSSLQPLFLACMRFLDSINLDPQAMVDRLWPKFELDPDFEKLLVSN